jgi:hypothetical protein
MQSMASRQMPWLKTGDLAIGSKSSIGTVGAGTAVGSYGTVTVQGRQEGGEKNGGEHRAKNGSSNSVGKSSEKSNSVIAEPPKDEFGRDLEVALSSSRTSDDGGRQTGSHRHKSSDIRSSSSNSSMETDSKDGDTADKSRSSGKMRSAAEVAAEHRSARSSRSSSSSSNSSSSSISSDRSSSSSSRRDGAAKSSSFNMSSSSSGSSGSSGKGAGSDAAYFLLKERGERESGEDTRKHNHTCTNSHTYTHTHTQTHTHTHTLIQKKTDSKTNETSSSAVGAAVMLQTCN